MTVTDDWQLTCLDFLIEEIWTGAFASGFGEVGDGRSFAFRIEHQELMVEVYRPRLAWPVPASACSRRVWPVVLPMPCSCSAAGRLPC